MPTPASSAGALLAPATLNGAAAADLECLSLERKLLGSAQVSTGRVPLH